MGVTEAGGSGAEGWVELSAVLEELRSELELAFEQGWGRQVAFVVPEVTVTLEAVVIYCRVAGPHATSHARRRRQRC
jgi:hypothetical protein